MKLFEIDDPMIVRVPAQRAASGRHCPATAFDFRPLRDGRPEGRRQSYTGCPLFAEQLVATMRDAGFNTGKLQHIFTQVRVFFIFADSHQASTGRSIDDVRQVPEVWQDFLIFLQTWPIGWDYEIVRVCRERFRLCRDFEGLDLPDRNPFPTIRQKKSETEPYSKEAQRQMLATFRGMRIALSDRIEKSNAMADTGRRPGDLLQTIYRHGLGKGFAEAHAADILRFVRDDMLTYDELPSVIGFRSRYGFLMNDIDFENEDAVPVSRTLSIDGGPRARIRGRNGLQGLYRRFLPTVVDLAPIAAEFMCLTGSNAQAVYDMDRRHCLRVYGTTAKIRSRKSRASRGVRKKGVVEFDSTTEPNSEHDVIQTALKLTEPAHDIIVRRLENLRKILQPDAATVREIDALSRLENRVWLVLNLRAIGITLLSDAHVRTEINEILRRNKIKENGAQLTWSSQRLRTSVIDDSLNANLSNLEAVSADVGHATLEMTDQNYFENARRVREEKQQIFEVMDQFSTPQKRKTAFASHFDPNSTAQHNDATMLVVTPAGKIWMEEHRDQTGIDLTVAIRKKSNHG